MDNVNDTKLDLKFLSIILKDLPDEQKIEKAFLLGVVNGMETSNNLVKLK